MPRLPVDTAPRAATPWDTGPHAATPFDTPPRASTPLDKGQHNSGLDERQGPGDHLHEAAKHEELWALPSQNPESTTQGMEAEIGTGRNDNSSSVTAKTIFHAFIILLVLLACFAPVWLFLCFLWH